MQQACLSKNHYAFHWPTGRIRPVSEVNQLGIEYASLPDGKQKEEKLLELCRCFHGYLMKYLNMILRGHLPKYENRVNRDAVNMLRYFIPRGKPVNEGTLSQTCRTLHLAFKQMSPDEVYDTLNFCFLNAVSKYDPHYVDKMKQVIGALEKCGIRQRSVSVEEVNENLDFDCSRLLRVLARRSHIAPEAASSGGKKARFAAGKWPPPEELFSNGPIGFTYFVQRWFKYFLQEFIESRMRELEAKDGLLPAGHRRLHSQVFQNMSDHDTVILPVAGRQELDRAGAHQFDVLGKARPCRGHHVRIHIHSHQTTVPPNGGALPAGFPGCSRYPAPGHLGTPAATPGCGSPVRTALPATARQPAAPGGERSFSFLAPRACSGCAKLSM